MLPSSLNPKIDRDLETICLKCLEKLPSSRYRSAAELVEELDRYLQGEPIRARRIGKMARLWRWCRRKPLAAGLIAASTAAMLFLAIGLRYRDSLEKANNFAAQAQRLRESAEKVAAAEKRAAAAEKYISLVQQVREKSVTKKWGWTWEAVELLKQAAAIDTPLSDPLELRSLAATVLSAFDLQEIGAVADGIAPGAIAFSPDGKRLAVGQVKHALSPTVYVYDVDSKKLESKYSFSNVANGFGRLLQGNGKYQDGYKSLTFSSDGRWLSGGTRFGRLVCWDTQADKPVAKVCQVLGDTDEIRQVMFSPGDDAILGCCSYSEEVCLWKFKESLTATVLKIKATSIAILPSHHTLAALVEDSLLLYDLETLQPLNPEPPRDDKASASDPLIRPLVASPDGHSLLCSSRKGIRLLNPVTGIEFFELEQQELSLAGSVLDQVSFNAENDVLAMSGRGGTQAISFFSKRTGQLLGNLSEPGVTEAAFNLSGDHLALRVDRKVKLYRYRSRECTTTIAHHNTRFADTQWNQDGSELTCLSDEDYADAQQGRIRWQQVSRWNADNGKLLEERSLTTYSRALGETRMHLDQSRDGRTVISTMCGPGIWNTGFGNSRFPGKPVVTPNDNQYFEIQEGDLLVESTGSGITIVEDSSASNGRALRIPAGANEWKVSLDLASLKLSSDVSEWAVFALVKTESPRNAGAKFVVGGQYGKVATLARFQPCFSHQVVMDFVGSRRSDRRISKKESRCFWNRLQRPATSVPS